MTSNARPALEAEIGELLDRARVPGAILVTTAGTRLRRGHASLEPPRPVTDDTWFHLFSGTKVYTATAIMLLVERGQLDLDAAVRTVLPDLPLRHEVTLRQLLAHDSGLPDTLKAFLAVHPGLDPAPSTTEVLGRYRLDRGKPPGSGARYGNVNFAILAEVITRVSGVAYERFVTEQVLQPLGADLAFRYTEASLEAAAVGYIPRWSPMRLALPFLIPDARPWINGGIAEGMAALNPFSLDNSAIGGLLGPADAYLPLVREMLSPDDGLLTAASKREMLTLHSHGPAGIVSREGVGLGWKLGRTRDGDFWNHEGGGPGFCTETRLYPDQDLGIVILSNLTHTAGLSRVCHEICELLRRAHIADRS